MILRTFSAEMQIVNFRGPNVKTISVVKSLWLFTVSNIEIF